MNVLLLDPSRVHHFTALWRAKLFKEAPPEAKKVASGAAMLGDGTAIMPLYGVLDYRPSWLSDLGMMCSTMQARADFNRLVADPSVSRIVLDVDSPGGNYYGVPEFASDIFAARAKKPVIAVANPMAASGGLWLAAAASKLYMLHSGEIGSIGCLMLHADMSEYFAGSGVKHTIIRSPEAKADFNSLEPLSEESAAHYQQQVENIADEFVRTMAKFRGVQPATAANKFGQGRMMMGDDACNCGLCDGMVSSLGDVLGNTGGGGSRKRAKLHPALEARLAAKGDNGEEDWTPLCSPIFAVVPANPPKGTGVGVDGEWAKPSLADFTDQQWSDLSDDEKVNIAKHFGWSDRMPPSDFSTGLKLPHHFPPNHENAGKASLAAVRNALARLGQTSGIPAAEKARIRTHLQAHLEE